MRNHSPSRLLIIGLFLAVTAVVARLHAAILSNEELRNLSRQAMEQFQYADTLMYLFAYTQKATTELQDPTHAREVEGAILWAKTGLRDEADRMRRLEAEVNSLRARLGDITSSVTGRKNRPPPLGEPTTVGRTTSPITCRGGGGMSFQLAADGPGITGTHFIIGFRRAAAGGSDSLGEGECAWLDRPVDPSEPDRICHVVEASNLLLSWSVSNGFIQGLSSAPAPYLVALAKNGVTVFDVYNNGAGCLVMTRGPSSREPGPRRTRRPPPR
jgi:hypothetical protein